MSNFFCSKDGEPAKRKENQHRRHENFLWKWQFASSCNEQERTFSAYGLWKLFPHRVLAPLNGKTKNWSKWFTLSDGSFVRYESTILEPSRIVQGFEHSGSEGFFRLPLCADFSFSFFRSLFFFCSLTSSQPLSERQQRSVLYEKHVMHDDIKIVDRVFVL